MSGFDDFDAFTERLRSLPEAVKGSDIAPSVETEIRRQVAAGQDPEGRPWAPTKKGAKPLPTAADSVGVAGIGDRVVIRTWGHVARHHLGRAKGGIERPIIPTTEIPKALGEVIAEAVGKRFAEHMEDD